MSSLLAVVDRAGVDNMLLVEDYLSRGTVGADEPASPAPPAAGGALHARWAARSGPPLRQAIRRRANSSRPASVSCQYVAGLVACPSTSPIASTVTKPLSRRS